MLLHSDLKLRRWDPSLNMISNNSVSPIRSYDDALGGGRVLSMKPSYGQPNQLKFMSRNPYQSLYYLPQVHSQENAIMVDNDTIRDSIEVAVKHYMFQERENIKKELFEEAMTDVRQELHYSQRKPTC
jgi:hypothetical protein